MLDFKEEIVWVGNNVNRNSFTQGLNKQFSWPTYQEGTQCFTHKKPVFKAQRSRNATANVNSTCLASYEWCSHWRCKFCIPYIQYGVVGLRHLFRIRLINIILGYAYVESRVIFFLIIPFNASGSIKRNNYNNKNNDRRFRLHKKKQREGQRSKRFVLAGQQLCTCSTLFSLACVSSETHKMCEPFFFLLIQDTKGRSCCQAFLAETVETGNNNRCVTEAMHVLRRKLRKD